MDITSRTAASIGAQAREVSGGAIQPRLRDAIRAHLGGAAVVTAFYVGALVGWATAAGDKAHSVNRQLHWEIVSHPSRRVQRAADRGVAWGLARHLRAHGTSAWVS